jgi:[protein-PII] uridylyltransferase
LRGSAFGRAYSALADAWLRRLVEESDGLAVLAVGGYGRQELCPGSDLDVLLLHDERLEVDAIAERLWYPLWDAGLQLDHSVRTVREAVAVAAEDLKGALGLLDARVVLGDEALGESLIARVRADWRELATRRLPGLDAMTAARHAEAGEVAFLLEPDIKEGHGGLRDVTTLAAIAAATEVVEFEESAGRARDTLLDVRVALQRATERRSNILGLEIQDELARELGEADAEALMTRVAGAARTIMWQTDDAWRRVRSWITGPPRRTAVGRDLELGHGVVLRDGEIALVDRDLAEDPAALPRVAAAAAHAEVPIERRTQRNLTLSAPSLVEPWPAEARDAFIALLGAGDQTVTVLEALDQHDLITRLIPEWAPVRSRAQRNPFHRFTVDRHLMETAARAGALTRSVDRPDLLLVSAFLHDIGKGYPGDHTAAGVHLVQVIATRMGFTQPDVELLAQLVGQHLLLPKIATSRDLADPATLSAVAAQVGTVNTLETLYALTEADSLATGPSAWSPWRAQLVDDLVEGVRAVLGDRAPKPTPPPIAPPPGPPAMQPQVEVRGDTVRVVGPDQPGLFATSVGLLSLHGQDVRTARAASSAEVAVAEFDVEPAFGKVVNPTEMETELSAALAGQLDLDERLDERARAYGRLRTASPAQLEPHVLVHADESPVAAIVEVRAADGVGVLYRIARTLVEVGLDIRLAKIATLGHEVVDTFYVVDAQNGRPPRADALARLEPRVIAALL